MDVFKTLKKNITETGKFAAEKAKIARDIFVIKEQIRNKKKEIRTLTYKIGQTYLDLHGEDYEEDFGAYIRGIAEAKAEMEAKDAELDRLKDQVKGSDIDDDEIADFLDEEDITVEELPDAAPEEAGEAEEIAEDPAEEAEDVEADIPEVDEADPEDITD